MTTGTDWYKPELNIRRPPSWRWALVRAVVLFLIIAVVAVCLSWGLLTLLVVKAVLHG
jgi:hypothetical protein